MPGIQSIVVRGITVTINGILVSLEQAKVTVEARWPDPLDGSEHQKRPTFEAAEIVAACTSLGARTIENAGQFQAYLVDLTAKLITNRWPELPPPE
jgi:hypothetical protein